MPRFSDEEAVYDYLNHSLGFHPGTADTAPKFEQVRNAFIGLGNSLSTVCPVQNEFFEKAIDALEIAQMQAIKSIAVHNPLGREQMRTA